jgi:fumarate reductase subunit D
MNPTQQQTKERMMKRADLLSGIKIMAKGMIAICILLVGILFPLGYEGAAAPVTLTIVHTSSVNGHLFACPS